MNFWQQLPKPFLVLAPMEDVTDTVFRRIVASCGRPARNASGNAMAGGPDVFVTEFTNCEGLFSEGRETVARRLQYTEGERPLVAQIWGTKPELFFKAAQLMVEMGFDGIDINMGCPEKSVVSHGACSALIKNPSLAREIIQATIEGIGMEGSHPSINRRIPVSVKTRIGYSNIQTEAWIGMLLQTGIDVLTVHGRTAAEMSAVPAHWDEIGKAVTLRNQMKIDTLIIGNGDVVDAEDALAKSKQYGVDGVMIGRGIFHNMWAFDRSGTRHEPTVKERLDLLVQHVRLFDTTWGATKNFSIMKKFFKIYCADFPGASDLRVKLMETKNKADVELVLASSPLFA